MNEIEKLRKENKELKEELRILKLKAEKQKKGMIEKAKQGNVMSRAPFGYKILNNKLLPNEDAEKLEKLFQEFQDKEISLNKLSKKHNLSVNGLKKVLTNFTYIGKIKFNGQTHPGNHKQLISTTLFNHVQDKLERRGIKK